MPPSSKQVARETHIAESCPSAGSEDQLGREPTVSLLDSTIH